MIPVRLELKNFLPFRSPDPILFEGIHLACLTGNNGAGKSSILDAITWVLWGKARAKRDEDLVHLGQDEMYIQMDFVQEGNHYRVVRKRSRGKRGTGSVDLFVYGDEGELRIISEPSMRATQEKINEILRLDYDTFVHSAFLQQGKADAFTTRTPAERKRILSEILGLEHWKVYEDRTKEKLKQITTDLGINKLRLDEIIAELAKRPQLLQDEAAALEAFAEAQEALDHAQQRLDEVAHVSDTLKRVRDQEAVLIRRIREHEGDLQAISQQIQEQEENIQAYEQLTLNQDDIEAGYTALKEAREQQSELAEKLQQMSDLDRQLNDLQRQLTAAEAELERERSVYIAKINDLEALLVQNQTEVFGEIQIQIKDLEEKETEGNLLSEEINLHKQELSAINANFSSIQEDANKIKQRIQTLEKTDDAECPLCGQPLDAHHRDETIRQLNDEVQEKRNQYGDFLTRRQELTDQVKQSEAYLDTLKREVAQLPGLRGQAGGLQEQMQTATDAQSQLDQISANLEAVQTTLESGAFAMEIREQMAGVEQQRQQVGYDEDTFKSTSATLEQYREYESQYTNLKIALDALPRIQQSLEDTQKRQQRVQKAVEDEGAELEKLQAEIQELELLVEEEQARRLEVAQHRTLLSTAQQRLSDAQQAVSTLERQEIRKVELEEQRELQLQEEATYRELRTAFGKDGVPAMIIETAIPELEATANDLLTRMTNGRMHLRMTTQREKVSGGTAETLDIEISDELGTRNYEMYSGGEAFRINFAIRVALSKLLARRAGAHLRTLFIDEGFGTQDDDGRSKLVEAINVIQEDFDLILVITHIEELRDSFPVHIMVDKTANGSMVRVQ